MTERRITLTPSQQEALPSAYQRLQQAEGVVRETRMRYAAICSEIGVDPNGTLRLEGDTLIVSTLDPVDAMLSQVEA